MESFLSRNNLMSEGQTMDQETYADLGADYFDKLDAGRIVRRHVRRFDSLGCGAILASNPKAA